MGVLSIFAFLLPSFFHAAIAPDGEAPGDGMLVGFWSSGVKQFVGTAYEAYDRDNRYSGRSPTAPLSKVWFTGAQGVITEVFWPTVDTAQVRDHQFLVTDGSSFFFEERKDAQTSVTWLADGVPAFRILNRDPLGRFEIERTVFTDPDRDVLLQRIKIIRHVAGLTFFLLHNPAVGNTPMGDTAFASLGASPGPGLFAWQNDQAQAVVFSIPPRQVTAGFEGISSDGWQDLKDFHLDSHYQWAKNGNVVLTASLDLSGSKGETTFDIAIGFGKDIYEAYRKARESLHSQIPPLDRYISQWQDYQRSIRDLSVVSEDRGVLFRSSIAVMKSMEDKTYEGAFVASPSVPWGQHTADASSDHSASGSRKHMISGYHVVWPRDLYQMATAFLAVDDPKSAVASLNFLRRIQFSSGDGTWQFGWRQRSKDGSFPQNCWVNGEPHWGGLQMDEAAMPVVLAHRLWREKVIHALEYWDMVKRAADFISEFGPWTAQERWEETMGASPSTIAAEIAALYAAADFAQEARDWERLGKYRTSADSWNFKSGDNVDTWTFTTSGVHGNGRYYTRIEAASYADQIWNPEDDAMFFLANFGGLWKEKNVTDAGFLELVRFGIRKALSCTVLESLPEVDQTIRVDFPGIGPGFRRYLGDRYNYDDMTHQQTAGMPWPILTGERGHYELAKAVELGLAPERIDRIVFPYIRSMELFSTESHMIPEQVWDGEPAMAKPTGAATPLGWAHAEYVKLLRSRLDRQVFDLTGRPALAHQQRY